MEQKNNTLLWIALFGLAYWIWYTRRQLIAEGGPLPQIPLIPTGNSILTQPVMSVPIATPPTPIASTAQTVQSTLVPVTIQSNQVNGFQTVPGRFGSIASCEL